VSLEREVRIAGLLRGGKTERSDRIRVGNFSGRAQGPGFRHSSAAQASSACTPETVAGTGFSTRLSAEVVDYPDSGKFGVYAELPAAGGKPAVFRYIGRTEANLNYWDGE
jgi:hypothetical protein